MKEFYKQYAEVENSFVELGCASSLEIIKKEYKKDILWGFGAENPILCFVGYGPSYYEVEKGLFFSDNPGKKLFGIINYIEKKSGVPLSERVYATKVIYELYDPTKGVDIDKYMEKFIDEIKYVNPENIVFIGKKVYHIFFDRVYKEAKVAKIDKYYPCFYIEDLRNLFFDRASTLPLLIKELDYIAEHVKKSYKSVSQESI